MKLTGNLAGIRIDFKGTSKMRVSFALEDVPLSEMIQLEFLPEGSVVLEIASPQAPLPGMGEVKRIVVPEAFR